MSHVALLTEKIIFINILDEQKKMIKHTIQ